MYIIVMYITILIIKIGLIICKHPFGTIKRTLGWDHFLIRKKKKVLGENSLIMFAYNFKRLINLIGIDLFKKLCLAVKENDLSQIREEIAAHILLFIQNMNHFYTIVFHEQYFLRKL